MKYYARLIKKYQKGDIIFSEDTDSDGMYIIDSGKVRVYKTISGPSGRHEIELCVLGSRAMFGEMAMIDDSKRSASVQAVEPTVCTVITKRIFEDQLSHIPVWMVNMIRILVQRLRETNEKLRSIVEQYTVLPQDDMGNILTVSPQKERVSVAACASESTGMEGLLKPQEIIRDLFEQKR